MSVSAIPYRGREVKTAPFLRDLGERPASCIAKLTSPNLTSPCADSHLLFRSLSPLLQSRRIPRSFLSHLSILSSCASFSGGSCQFLLLFPDTFTVLPPFFSLDFAVVFLFSFSFFLFSRFPLHELSLSNLPLFSLTPVCFRFRWSFYRIVAHVSLVNLFLCSGISSFFELFGDILVNYFHFLEIIA